MRQLLPLALLALAAPLSAADAPAHLAGVSDDETTIPSGGVTQFHRGKGDVLFVLDRTGHWYRLGLNEGCLRQTTQVYSVVFDNSTPAQRIDRFTRVKIDGTLPVNCAVASIRRSEAPPQVNSKSPVTLD